MVEETGTETECVGYFMHNADHVLLMEEYITARNFHHSSIDAGDGNNWSL